MKPASSSEPAPTDDRTFPNAAAARVMLRYPSKPDLPCVMSLCFHERFGCVDSLLLSSVDAAQYRPQHRPAIP